MEIGRREQLIILAIMAALLFGGGYKLAQLNRDQETKAGLITAGGEAARVMATEDFSGGLIGGSSEAMASADSAPESKAVVLVHVAGAVAKPGLYELSAGARVNDAVTKAQPLPDADLDNLNLAEKLADGQKILVPAKGVGQEPDGEARGGFPGGYPSPGGKVNINTATELDLDALPGIGPALARRIIEYRRDHGFFNSVEELRQVPGIGEKKFAELKDYISL